MSHSVEVKPAFKSLARTLKAFSELGWKVQQNAHMRTWGDAERAKVREWVAVNPHTDVWTDYDIAVSVDPLIKEIKLVYDDMLLRNEHFLAELGEDMCKLKQQYTRLTMLEEADRRMGTIHMETDADGVIHGIMEVEVML